MAGLKRETGFVRQFLGFDLEQPTREPLEPPPSAVIVSCCMSGDRSRPSSCSRRLLELTKNSAVSLSMPTLTQPVLAAES